MRCELIVDRASSLTNFNVAMVHPEDTCDRSIAISKRYPQLLLTCSRAGLFSVCTNIRLLHWTRRGDERRSPRSIEEISEESRAIRTRFARHHRSRQTVMPANARRAHANVPEGGQMKELISLIERRLTCTRAARVCVCVCACVSSRGRDARANARATKAPKQEYVLGSRRGTKWPRIRTSAYTVSRSGSRLCIVLKINDETEQSSEREREREREGERARGVGSFPVGGRNGVAALTKLHRNTWDAAGINENSADYRIHEIRFQSRTYFVPGGWLRGSNPKDEISRGFSFWEIAPTNKCSQLSSVPMIITSRFYGAARKRVYVRCSRGSC